MAHLKSLWFSIWFLSLILGAVAASGVIHDPSWSKLAGGLVVAFNTVSTFLAAQWQAPEKPGVAQPEDKA